MLYIIMNTCSHLRSFLKDLSSCITVQTNLEFLLWKIPLKFYLKNISWGSCNTAILQPPQMTFNLIC